jgi:hypothetical protein
VVLKHMGILLTFLMRTFVSNSFVYMKEVVPYVLETMKWLQVLIFVCRQLI